MTETIICFTFNGIETKIQCSKNDYIRNIFQRYSTKIQKDLNEIYFLYEGKMINQEQKLSSLNSKDNVISIIVYPFDFDSENNININSLKKSKYIICPKCFKECIIDIKDYKISLNCFNKNHNLKGYKFSEFEKTQLIDESSIKCNSCDNNKSTAFNNKFYKCCNCNQNLCPLCKIKHNQEHEIVLDYDLKEYKCNLHKDEKYTYFCSQCNKNICSLCRIEHKNHHVIDYYDLMVDINKDENTKNFQDKINVLKNNVQEMINKLNKFIANIEIYQQIYNDINNNLEYRNYQLLSSIQNIEKNHESIIKNIDDIINSNSIVDKFKKIIDIYSMMEDDNTINTINNNDKNKAENIIIPKDDNNSHECNDSIKIIYKINKNDEEINIFGIHFVNHNKEKCKMIINGKMYSICEKIKYEDYLINKEKEYLEIILTDINNITDMSFLFSHCPALMSVPDISKWDTKNITDMSRLFLGCSSLTSLPDISKWEIQNVKDINNMFCGCRALNSLPDISNWRTKNVVSMSWLFAHCSLLKSIPNISNWNVEKVKNMSYMFFNCSSLNSLPDISKWNIKKETNIQSMFSGCKRDLNIPGKFIKK